MIWDTNRVVETYSLALRHLPPSQIDALRPHLLVIERWRRSSGPLDDDVTAAAEAVAAEVFDAARQRSKP